MEEVRWERLRPRDIEARFKGLPVVYTPFGSLEWHGYHNPLGLDAVKAWELCIRAARKGGGVVTPATFWPIGGMPHPWTVRMSEDLIHDLAVAIFEQMGHVGFKVVIAVTGHYGFEQVYQIKKAALEVMYRSGMSIYALPEYEAACDTGYRGDHAAKWETSIMMYLFPELVNMEEAEPAEMPMDGVGGEDPRIHASRELGEKVCGVIVERLTSAAKTLLDLSPRERSRFITAAEAHLRALNAHKWGAMRAESYWRGVLALSKGEYQEAIKSFNQVGEEVVG
jgi:creatinine amidohydrolase